jgi:DNA-binding NtrC family response regulator
MNESLGRVLIVDDEPALLRMMSVYLARLGYSVTTVGSTDEAWTAVERAPMDFDIAVLDATMPGMTMRDLAARILEANPSMRVLTASGYPVDMTPFESVAPGRTGFLHKPFTPEMLGAAVRRMLAAQEEV